ncbi:hypothetical protein RclHR1_01270006 [Rhizophagus clarus]|uniref:Uncharacterized protein n=1 Tax=Rhizophagus clarus TaxID=94130 RepID=A0A2Z6Q7V5_9GLOM|nr:hypothetical protein RclHR1_01270006 [Rhizophagus clarus]
MARNENYIQMMARDQQKKLINNCNISPCFTRITSNWIEDMVNLLTRKILITKRKLLKNEIYKLTFNKRNNIEHFRNTIISIFKSS